MPTKEKSASEDARSSRIVEVELLEGQWDLLSSQALDASAPTPQLDDHGPAVVKTLSITVPTKGEAGYWISSAKARGLSVEMLAQKASGSLYRIEEPDSCVTSNKVVVGWVGQGLVFDYGLYSRPSGVELELISKAYNLRQTFKKTNDAPRVRLSP